MEPDGPHRRTIEAVCSEWLHVIDPLSFVYNAIAVLEGQRIRPIGVAPTRRALRMLTPTFADENVKALVRLLWSIFSPIRGPGGFHRDMLHDEAHADIQYFSLRWPKRIIIPIFFEYTF